MNYFCLKHLMCVTLFLLSSYALKPFFIFLYSFAGQDSWLCQSIDFVTLSPHLVPTAASSAHWRHTNSIASCH
jgi:hypothetical protein